MWDGSIRVVYVKVKMVLAWIRDSRKVLVPHKIVRQFEILLEEYTKCLINITAFVKDADKKKQPLYATER